MRTFVAAVMVAALLADVSALAESVPFDPRTSSDAGAPNSIRLGKQAIPAVTRANEWLPLAKIACDSDAPAPPSDISFSWSGACIGKLLDGPGELALHQRGRVAVTLIGQFVKGVAEGHETIRYADGSVFEGEFHGDKPNGPGALRTPRGIAIEGGFRNDVPNGKVHFVSYDGDSSDRTYNDGVADGPAAIDWVDVKTVLAYRDGRVEGPVVTTYGDGSRLEFNYKDDVVDPVATFTDPSGQRFSGAFVPSRIDPALPPHGMSYPSDALSRHETGTAYVSLIIGPSGHVQSASLAKSSGFEDLDTAAVDAVKTWSYIAATVDGHPIPTSRMVPVPFVIH